MLRTYLLFIEVGRLLSLRVGRLGSVTLTPATYIYVGSGRRRLLARVRRHFARDKKVFWHIDHVTSRVKPSLALLLEEDERTVARLLSAKMSYVPGFGSSDDPENPSHLFMYPGTLESAVRAVLRILGGP